MTPERWEKITEIYHAALESDAARRGAFLDQACAGDDSLRREVESLLKADAAADAGEFIAQPALQDAAAMLTVKTEAPLQAGQNLGHYRIISRLGAGGMGEVYLGRDVRLNRQVAIKILPASLASNPNYLRRFRTEAEAAATLNHPHVAVVHSVEKVDGRLFITMEHVAGKTLDASIPAEGFDVKSFLELFIPLADALAHAHEKGVIHRDIKPGNIMLTPDGAPKILDFGLAQIDRPKAGETEPTLKITRPVRMTEPGQVFGTPSYMSPEQAEGKPVDHRTDIFSFGVLMYEAMTATRPFRGDSYASIISNLLKTEPVPVSEIKKDTPYLLSRLISRCLCKSRRERFQSMSEVRAILEETKAAVEAGVSLDSGLHPVVSRREPRFALKWLFASLVLVVLLAVPAFYYFRQSSAPPEPPISFANMSLRRLSQTGTVGYAQIAPDGKSIVYITIDDAEGRSLWIRRIEDRSALPLILNSARQFWGGIAVSPDNSQIFYIQADENARVGTLYRISSLGGSPRKLVEQANDVGSLSADGQRILFARYGERSQIVSINANDGGGEQVIHTGAEKELFRDPKFSADGKSVFFSKRKIADGKTSWTLAEIPAAGGAERTILASGGKRIGELAVLNDGTGILINKTDDVSKLHQLYYVALPDGREQRLTNDLNSYQGVSVSLDGKIIAATQNHTTRDIWIGQNQNDLRRLTAESNAFSNAVFTPDGRVVYDALDNNRPNIWIVNADGTNAQQLTPNETFNSEPQVSPDGRFIVFTSDRTGESKIWRMNTDGSNPQLLTDVAGPAFSPVISPDGQSVWFQWIRSNRQILAKIPIAGGEAVEQQPAFGDNLWAVSPDGRQVAVSFFDEPSNQFKLRVRPTDAEEPSKIFNIPASFILEWTRDGKNLLYRHIDTTPEMFSIVWKQPLDGGEPKQFLSVKPDRITRLSQSKDGKQLLVVRSRSTSDAVMLTKVSNE